MRIENIEDCFLKSNHPTSDSDKTEIISYLKESVELKKFEFLIMIDTIWNSFPGGRNIKCRFSAYGEKGFTYFEIYATRHIFADKEEEIICAIRNKGQNTDWLLK